MNKKWTLRVQWDLLSIFLLSTVMMAVLWFLLPTHGWSALGKPWIFIPVLLVFFLEALSFEEESMKKLDLIGRVNGFFGSLTLPAILSLGRLGVASFYFPGITIFGVATLFTGVAVRFWAKAVMGCHFSYSLRVLEDHKLIMKGPYRFIRHPAYLGTWLMLVSFPLLFRSWIPLVVLPCFIPMTYKQILYEESLLTKKFGQEYEDYIRRVPPILPISFQREQY